jgi:putative endonuclease
MADHNELGRAGESMAREYFATRGFDIICMNWRHSFYEIDMIASRNNKLHFIEVKTRNSDHFGYPEQSFSKKKLNNLKQAAEQYLYKHPQWKLIQFDVLSITLKKSGPEFFLIEDVF